MFFLTATPDPVVPPTIFSLGQEFIAPVIAGIFLIITAVVAAVLARRNSTKGNREVRAPNVQEMWAQQEMDRRARQIMEDMWWDLRSAFKSYFRRVSSLVLTLGIEDKRFNLTPMEKKAIEATPPEDPGPAEAGK